MFLESYGIPHGFGESVGPRGWKVVWPKWWLYSDCCVTLVKWLPLSDFLHVLASVARNVGSSNSEHSILYPSCFPSPLTLALFLLIGPSLLSFPSLLFLPPFILSSCFSDLTCHVETRCQSSPWESTPFYLLRMRGVEGFSGVVLTFVPSSVFQGTYQQVSFLAGAQGRLRSCDPRIPAEQSWCPSNFVAYRHLVEWEGKSDETRRLEERIFRYVIKTSPE